MIKATSRIILLTLALATASAAGQEMEPGGTPQDSPARLEPFVAVYQARANVLGLGGDVTMRLAATDEPGVYVFHNTSRPRGLASLVAGEEVECSRFRYTDGLFEPIVYHEDAGDDSSTIRFRDDESIADSRYKGREVRLELEPHTLDRATEQMAVRSDLLAAAPELGPYRTIERNEYRVIEYRPEGTAQVSVPVGEYHTVAFRRHRVGSRRTVLIHYAPELDWMPIKIEQFKGEKKQVTAVLKSYRPGTPDGDQARGNVTPRCP